MPKTNQGEVIARQKSFVTGHKEQAGKPDSAGRMCAVVKRLKRAQRIKRKQAGIRKKRKKED